MDLHLFILSKVIFLFGGVLLYTVSPSTDDPNYNINQTRNVFKKNGLEIWQELEHTQGSCPCVGKTLCQRINRTVNVEVFVFSVNNKFWQKYDWTKITTLVEFGYHDDNLLCFAHSKGARLLQNANFPASQLTNSTARHLWVKQQLTQMSSNFLDGINVDFESEIDKGSTATREGLTLLIQELTITAKSIDPQIQITVDFAWSPDCIDKRCYDYKAIAEVVDMVFVMFYDERSQIKGPCIAWANSAYYVSRHGLQQHLALGISAQKLILGIPWYGYHYQCEMYDKVQKQCYIKHIPFRGANCSDTAGRQITYGAIMNTYLPQSTGRLWDSDSQSPFMEIKDNVTSNTVSQIWYDDLESLGLKYQLVGELNLRGVGMWNADTLDYSDSGQITDMWGGLL